MLLTDDLLLTLLLPLPPWLGFWIFRRKGRVGLSYGYFLGGILLVLALPWADLTGRALPTAQMGGALFGFTLFLQAHREGAHGLRRLGVGVGGASIFSLLLLAQLGLGVESVVRFWATALLEGGLWLVLSDLGYRLTHGRWLQLRVPLVGGSAMALGTLPHRWLWPDRHPLPVWAALVGGTLLGLVALQQLLWLRRQGTWVEGRGNGLRIALSALEQDDKPEARALSIGIEPQQPMLLVNERGMVLECNGPFSRMVGLSLHQIRGYRLDGLLQGGEASAWEDLKEQLLRDSHGSTRGTLVRLDGSFQDVGLEAVAFDRNLAMVWIQSEDAGSLSLRTEARGWLSAREDLESRRLVVNALGSILPAAEQILTETGEDRTREAAELIFLAVQRLRPSVQGAEPEAGPSLDAPEAMEAVLPRLQRMLPAGYRLTHRTASLPLAVTEESLYRMATHLVLHARQVLASGTLTLSLESRSLGGRPWALLGVEVDGPSAGAPPREMLGLSWLQQAVREARAMLELSEDPTGGTWPVIYLPVAQSSPALQSPLLGRRVWIVDQDLLVRDGLAALVRHHGGEAEAFPDLRQLLKASRSERAPDLLVLERTPTLERFHKAIRAFQREVIPTLVMGNGEGLSVNPWSLGLRKVGFLEKPFPSQEFVQSLLALLALGNGKA